MSLPWQNYKLFSAIKKSTYLRVSLQSLELGNYYLDHGLINNFLQALYDYVPLDLSQNIKT